MGRRKNSQGASAINSLVKDVSKRLRKLNDKIDNWNDDAWRAEQMEKMHDKRDELEALLRDVMGECRSYGVPVEQLDLPIDDDELPTGARVSEVKLTSLKGGKVVDQVVMR